MNIQEVQFSIYIAIYKAGLLGYDINSVLEDLQDMDVESFLNKYDGN